MNYPPSMPRSYKHGVTFAILENIFPLKEDFWLPSQIVCPRSFYEVDTNQWVMWRRRDSCLLHYLLQEFLGKESELPDSP